MSPALGRAVLNEDAREGRPSMTMNGGTPPVLAAVARRLRVRTEIIFFQRKGGGGARKGGAGLR